MRISSRHPNSLLIPSAGQLSPTFSNLHLETSTAREASRDSRGGGIRETRQALSEFWSPFSRPIPPPGGSRPFRGVSSPRVSPTSAFAFLFVFCTVTVWLRLTSVGTIRLLGPFDCCDGGRFGRWITLIRVEAPYYDRFTLKLLFTKASRVWLNLNLFFSFFLLHLS